MCLVVLMVVFKRPRKKAILKVEKFNFAITQLAHKRFKRCMWKSRVRHYTSKERKWENKAIVEKETEVWGIEIIDVKIKDIQLPENMRRMMANQAEAERSRRARIILALAEEQAAGKLLEVN
jgi:regulator of protease activity HflC (stomatin/prohibitin superfamily)